MSIYAHFSSYFFLGAGGAAALELLKLWEYREKVPVDKYAATLRSPIFWALVIGMLCASGFIAWATNAHAVSADPWQIVLAGIGARSLLWGPAQAGTSRRKMKLGEKEVQSKFVIRDWLSR